jgi:hypothetical protein
MSPALRALLITHAALAREWAKQMLMLAHELEAEATRKDPEEPREPSQSSHRSN